MKKTLFGFLFMLVLLLPLCAFDISGKIRISMDMPLHIYLVDEACSKKPFTGIQELTLTPDKEDLANGYIMFEFGQVEKGTYGIRVFQDKNGNGKLDKGLFGPAEPWGLSWKNGKSSRRPKFRDYSFDVSADRKDLVICLQ